MSNTAAKVLLAVTVFLLMFNLYFGVSIQLKLKTITQRENQLVEYERMMVDSFTVIQNQVQTGKAIMILAYQILVEVNDNRSSRLFHMLEALDKMEDRLELDVERSRDIYEQDHTTEPVSHNDEEDTIYGLGGVLEEEEEDETNE